MSHSLSKNHLDPPAYDGLDQYNHNTECTNGDNCNNQRWEPWRTFPQQCVHCHATYNPDGTIDGDEGCFDNAIQYVETHNDNQVLRGSKIPTLT